MYTTNRFLRKVADGIDKAVSAPWYKDIESYKNMVRQWSKSEEEAEKEIEIEVKEQSAIREIKAVLEKYGIE